LKQKAFTLVELLVVIAVIGILSAVVVISTNSAKAKARDAIRISDLKGISQALEMYFQANDAYPCPAVGCDRNGYLIMTTLKPYLAEYYPGGVPDDPKIGNLPCFAWDTTTTTCTGYRYSYGNVGKTTYSPQYDLTTKLETVGHAQACGNHGWKLYLNSTMRWCRGYQNQWPSGIDKTNEIYEGSSTR
jgi:prepilin-type N-terminal cleavage/methylation domain-containing protein